NKIEGVQFRFAQTGAYFEGALTPDGLLTSGSTGVMPAAVAAIVEGERPVIERFEIRMVPGPAARIAMSPEISRLVPGQRIRLDATVLSALGDRRDDRVQWSSSNPRVLTVNEVGLVTAVAAGSARLTAKVGDVEQTLDLQVMNAQVASLSVEPGVTDARTGDVLRFRAVARDAQGREIAGVTPVWSFSPGQVMLGADGSFVG